MSRDRRQDRTLEALRNLGPTSSRWLADIGVRTRADLEALGAVEAYRRVAARERGASLNLLYALQGALLDLPWNRLPPELKEALREEVSES